MKPEEVLINLKNFELWDFADYPLSKREAQVCVKALNALIEKEKRKGGTGNEKTDTHEGNKG